ncbi:dehydrogenase/reductase SDR family member 4-like [Ruditapes philippinarum]|uniref:dehydrogenase/reductase SDR family member 4-like n=1 Tax=Ruditapes philippinarum TaxID=129788 RepID=UPI00295AF6E6|nr:dehydrogenase/reductase SDR family member 4-like [Ruditapes philippinarum]
MLKNCVTLGRRSSFLLQAIRMSSSAAGNGKLSGKVAVVTASTEGIGLAIARRLGQDGAKVMVSSRKQDNVDKTVSQLKSENLDVAGLVCHVGKAEDRTKLIEQTLSQFGGIDILVSNAAANPTFGPMLDTPESAWDKIFDTNVKAAFFLCKEIVPHMEKRGGGSVVFVSSFAGYTPMEFLGPYSVSKTALIGLTKALVPQLSSMNIRVNCVAPGVIQTKFSEQLWKNPAIKDMILQMIPMHRVGEPPEVAGLVSFLSSDDASYITGETTLVTGGIPGRL